MILSARILLIILVKLVFTAVQSQTLQPDAGGNGVCTQTISYRASRYVPYLETYKEKAWGIFYETKVRVNYKVQYDTQYRTEEVCCDGYEELAGYCFPKCDPPCNHGLCNAPNLCMCYPGYEEVPHATDFACHPVCTFNCGPGTCVGPDECSCDEGYSTTKNGIFCEPHCEQDCEKHHGTCVAPNTCACNAGYKEVEDDRVCEPQCEIPCKNGVCTVPNFCTCHPGYEADLSSHEYVCHPVCRQNCGHGTCVKPDTCSCDEGYSTEKDGLTCQPHCEQDCEKHNATCVAPNTCACNAGYKKVKDGRICEPQCIFPCANGVCTKPNYCTCNEGYIPSLYVPLTCVPKCVKGCKFGLCVGPNTCMCNTGYKKISDSVCEPICRDGCVMGKCIAPNTCSCNEGYGLLDGSNHICYPICEKTCTNGNCTAPGVCTCDEGFRMMKDEFEDEICKPYCEPQCEPYGECTAPNTCACFEGYHQFLKDADFYHLDNSTTLRFRDFFVDKSVCRPNCPEGCFNGFCSSPNVCSCLPGYEHSDDNKSNVCSPICEKPCGPNHRCSAPNKCTCKEGYRAQRVNNCTSAPCEETCDPVCEVPCGPGASCSGPNNCTCNEGYRAVQDGAAECEPECTIDCGGGTCTGPGICTCHYGYENDESGACVPACDPPCTLGTCTYLNNCLCPNEANKTCEELHCEKNCVNGDCIADQCFCPTGSVGVTNGNVTECTNCTRQCLLHGRCVDGDGTCECDFGFAGENCDEPTVCSFFILDRNITLSNVLPSVNESVFNAYIYSPYCFDCANDVNNDSLCFYNGEPEDSDRTIRCIVSKELSCYEAHVYNPLKVVVKTTGIVGGTAILIMCMAFLAAYISLNKARKRDICRGRSQNANGQARVGTESLLPEEAIQL